VSEDIIEKVCEVVANKKEARPSICFVDLEQKDAVVKVF